RALVSAGQIVICAGGGGVPVVREGKRFRGIAAVIDKDLASSLLASGLGADTFIISTGVPRVCLDFDKPCRREIETAAAGEMRRFIEEGHFAPGSMLPKIKASLEFLERGGRRVIITSPGSILAALEGRAGTIITP
ncbi:carbamate kinase, partial [Candidatus Fermentibacteria bacterium]|nr:carbamate kinase [Candidatus Fermentibacteria bacterium]